MELVLVLLGTFTPATSAAPGATMLDTHSFCVMCAPSGGVKWAESSKIENAAIRTFETGFARGSVHSVLAEGLARGTEVRAHST